MWAEGGPPRRLVLFLRQTPLLVGLSLPLGQDCLCGGQGSCDLLGSDLQGRGKALQGGLAPGTADLTIAQGIHPPCGFERVLVAEPEPERLAIKPKLLDADLDEGGERGSRRDPIRPAYTNPR
jgi:hypothetical protein